MQGYRRDGVGLAREASGIAAGVSGKAKDRTRIISTNAMNNIPKEICDRCGSTMTLLFFQMMDTLDGKTKTLCEDCGHDFHEWWLEKKKDNQLSLQ
jgi:hypothetical protein